jgi:hypothetical protein
MVAKLATSDFETFNNFSNLEEQIIYLCQKMVVAQSTFNSAYPQYKRNAIELHQDSLSKTIVAQLVFPIEGDSFTAEAIGEIFPTAPTPTPPPVILPSLQSYAVSQSLVWGGREATYAGLTNGVYNHAFVSSDNYPFNWFKFTFSQDLIFTGVGVGGGFDETYGPINLTGLQIQYSTDDATWITVTTIASPYTSGTTLFRYDFPESITTHLWRFGGSSYRQISQALFYP